MSPLHAALLVIIGLFVALFIFAFWPLVYTPPRAGETWRFKKDKGDPWDTDSGHLVTVLDAKDGWVRYSFGSVFCDQRMKARTFLYCYAKAAPSEGLSTKSETE